MLNLTEIGIRLKSIRGSMTQKNLAEEFGVKRSYIANIETGRTQPSLEYLFFVSKKFNISTDWILHGERIKSILLQSSPTHLTDELIFKDMITYMQLIWNSEDQSLQTWLKIQFKKCFPHYQEELKKLKKSSVVPKS